MTKEKYFQQIKDNFKKNMLQGTLILLIITIFSYIVSSIVSNLLIEQSTSTIDLQVTLGTTLLMAFYIYGSIILQYLDNSTNQWRIIEETVDGNYVIGYYKKSTEKRYSIQIVSQDELQNIYITA